MSTYFVIADDAIVYRCKDAGEARGYAAAYSEHVGEDAEAFEVRNLNDPTVAYVNRNVAIVSDLRQEAAEGGAE